MERSKDEGANKNHDVMDLMIRKIVIFSLSPCLSDNWPLADENTTKLSNPLS